MDARNGVFLAWYGENKFLIDPLVSINASSNDLKHGRRFAILGVSDRIAISNIDPSIVFVFWMQCEIEHAGVPKIPGRRQALDRFRVQLTINKPAEPAGPFGYQGAAVVYEFYSCGDIQSFRNEDFYGQRV